MAINFDKIDCHQEKRYFMKHIIKEKYQLLSIRQQHPVF